MGGCSFFLALGRLMAGEGTSSCACAHAAIGESTFLLDLGRLAGGGMISGLCFRFWMRTDRRTGRDDLDGGREGGGGIVSFLVAGLLDSSTLFSGK